MLQVEAVPMKSLVCKQKLDWWKKWNFEYRK